jgi:hypothetical protein
LSERGFLEYVLASNYLEPSAKSNSLIAPTFNRLLRRRKAELDTDSLFDSPHVAGRQHSQPRLEPLLADRGELVSHGLRRSPFKSTSVSQG